MAIPRFVREHSAVLVIDMQEKLLPHMHNAQAITPQVGRLLDGAGVLELPVLVTEQYPKGLGRTKLEVERHYPAAVYRQEKTLFSACTPEIRKELSQRQTRNVIVCGIEAHVCVLQTCLDLMSAGFVVGVAVDAIGSRRAVDQEAAVQRMGQAGAVPTTVESVLLEMVRQAGTDLFKAMLPVVK